MNLLSKVIELIQVARHSERYISPFPGENVVREESYWREVYGTDSKKCEARAGIPGSRPAMCSLLRVGTACLSPKHLDDSLQMVSGDNRREYRFPRRIAFLFVPCNTGGNGASRRLLSTAYDGQTAEGSPARYPQESILLAIACSLAAERFPALANPAHFEPWETAFFSMSIVSL